MFLQDTKDIAVIILKFRSLCGIVVKLLAFCSSLLDETLNRGPMTTFQDKLLTRTDCDEAGDYVMPNVLSPRDLVISHDIGHKLYHHHPKIQEK